jgi:hypothetical protein
MYRASLGLTATGVVLCLAGGVLALVKSAPVGATTGAGVAVNAVSGKLERSPAILAPEDGAFVDGGDILRGCDLSREPECRFDHPPNALVVHQGDIVQFLVLLHDSGWRAVPYIKLSVNTGARIGVKPPGIGVSMEVAWPRANNSDEAERYDATTVVVKSPASSRYRPHLRYIRGSTVLQRRNHRVLAHLPDGITGPIGLALTNVGPPRQCFDCNDQYDRFVAFKVRAEVP